MLEDAMKHKSAWSYSSKPGMTAVAAAGILLSVLVAILLFRYDHSLLSFTLVLPGMIAGWSFARLSRSTTIEIDLDEGLVTKKEKLWFSKKVSTYPLRDFNEVKMSRQGALVEEGYGVIRYVLALEGSGTTIEVYSTEDEQQARMIQQMLVQYLSLPEIRFRTRRREDDHGQF